MLIAAAIAIGVTAWSGEPRLLPVAMLFPALWALAPTRLGAMLLAAGYFLAALRGLPQGVSNFYGSGFAAGIALRIAASVLFVGVHSIAWAARAIARMERPAAVPREISSRSHNSSVLAAHRLADGAMPPWTTTIR